ncbi:MAG: matrixin family metalloprotease [Myxococcales bacterium]|nr:matrixin family metalloprotease [Myxococcales bacterium]
MACGPQAALPGVEAQLAGHAECTTQGFSRNALRNINSVSVVTHGRPEPGEGQVALTTVTSDRSTGEIFDADIALNAEENTFTVGDEQVRTDLQSTLTHEIGHLLGLEHSDVSGATMGPSTDLRSTSLRTLERDDVEGLCALYAPQDAAALCDGDQEDAVVVCEQVATQKFVTYGCAVAGSSRRQGPSGWGWLSLAVGLGVRFRRSSP